MTVMDCAAPERSLQQRMDALATANTIRVRRSALKRGIKAGRVSVVGLLLEPPEFIGTMKLHDVLMAVPKMGRVKVHRLLVAGRISPSKTVGGLSSRQRAEIVSLVAPSCRGRS